MHTEHLTIAIWKFAKGADFAMHRHPQEQTIYVLQGRVEYPMEQGAVVVEAGDHLVFAGDEPHGLRALEDTILMDLFSAHREDFRAKFPALAPEA